MKIIINHFFTQIKTKAKPTGEIPLHQPFSSEIGPAANFCVANNPCPALGISDCFTSKPKCASVNILTAWRPWMNVRHGVGVKTNAVEDLVTNIWFCCRFMRMLFAQWMRFKFVIRRRWMGMRTRKLLETPARWCSQMRKQSRHRINRHLPLLVVAFNERNQRSARNFITTSIWDDCPNSLRNQHLAKRSKCLASMICTYKGCKNLMRVCKPGILFLCFQ